MSIIYDFESKDYSLDLIAHTLFVCEKEKDPKIKHKTTTTALKIQEVMKECQILHQGLSTIHIQTLQDFVMSLDLHIQRNFIKKYYPYVGHLTIMTQKLLGVGRLGILLSVQDLLEKQKPNEKSSVIIKQGAFSHIIKRFEQIRSARFEEKELDKHSILTIALYIEEHIFRPRRQKKHFQHHSETGLARSLQLDPQTNDVYLLSQPEFSILKDGHTSEKDIPTFKQVGACVRLTATDRTLHPEIAAYLVTKVEDLSLDIIKEDLKNTRREVDYCRQFSNVRGLVQFRCATSFKVDNICRMSLIFKKAEGQLHSLIFREQRPLSLFEKLTIAIDLTHGLHYLHENDILHGDLKLQNALFNKNAQGVVIEAKLCDFGCCFTFNRETPHKTKIPEVYSFGHSGTASFTPPELYGETDFTGNYFKLDMWGLGCILYQLLLKKELPWKQEIDNHIKENFDDQNKCYKNKRSLIKAQKKFKQAVEKEIEINYQALFKKEPLTLAERFELLVYQMLRLQPEERIDSTSALTELTNLLSSSSPSTT